MFSSISTSGNQSIDMGTPVGPAVILEFPAAAVSWWLLVRSYSTMVGLGVIFKISISKPVSFDARSWWGISYYSNKTVYFDSY